MSEDILLTVPYYSQRDSVFREQRGRMCYSSSNAMLLEYLKPGTLKGKYPPDDNYLVRVLEFGDTVMAHAQVSALKSFGVNAEFRTNLDWTDIDAQLRKHIPVPIGILIYGHANNPYGGGHWILVIGRKADGSAYYVHDPYGELNLLNGGYNSENGQTKLYSKNNLSKRWKVGTPHGWGIIARNEPPPKEEKSTPQVEKLTKIKGSINGVPASAYLINNRSFIECAPLPNKWNGDTKTIEVFFK